MGSSSVYSAAALICHTASIEGATVTTVPKQSNSIMQQRVPLYYILMLMVEQFILFD